MCCWSFDSEESSCGPDISSGIKAKVQDFQMYIKILNSYIRKGCVSLFASEGSFCGPDGTSLRGAKEAGGP